MRYIDMHCDTVSLGLGHHGYTDIINHPDMHVDIDRLYEIGTGVQFFAAFIPQANIDKWFPHANTTDQYALFEKQRDFLLNSISLASDKIALAKNYEDIKANEAAGKVSAVFTLEDASFVDGKMENIKMLKDNGISCVALSWNDSNCFGQANSTDPELMSKGLTAFGMEAVPYMNDLGIIIDVSHLSDGSFYDIARITKKPFVASHSDCRAIAPHQRNLTDDMIRTLADCGGVSGINVCYAFINPSMDDQFSTVEGVIRHIDHFINIGGEDVVGIGTDFDGIPEGTELNGCDKMHLLFEGLEKHGYSDDLIEKIAFGNVARVIKECL